MCGQSSPRNTGLLVGTKRASKPPLWPAIGQKRPWHTTTANPAAPNHQAGAVGFEPTIAGSKVPCLTAWPRPNTRNYYSIDRCTLQLPLSAGPHEHIRANPPRPTRSTHLGPVKNRARLHPGPHESSRLNPEGPSSRLKKGGCTRSWCRSARPLELGVGSPRAPFALVRAGPRAPR